MPRNDRRQAYTRLREDLAQALAAGLSTQEIRLAVWATFQEAGRSEEAEAAGPQRIEPAAVVAHASTNGALESAGAS